MKDCDFESSGNRNSISDCDLQFQFADSLTCKSNIARDLLLRLFSSSLYYLFINNSSSRLCETSS